MMTDYFVNLNKYFATFIIFLLGNCQSDTINPVGHNEIDFEISDDLLPDYNELVSLLKISNNGDKDINNKKLLNKINKFASKGYLESVIYRLLTKDDKYNYDMPKKLFSLINKNNIEYNVNKQDKYGNTILHSLNMTYEHSHDFFDQIIAMPNFNPHIVNSQGESYLHKDYLKLNQIKKLIDLGIDINKPNKDKKTPIDYALGEDIIMFYVNHKKFDKQKNNLSELYRFVLKKEPYKNQKVLKWLEDNKVKIKFDGKPDNKSLIHDVIMFGYDPLYKLLTIAYKQKINIKKLINKQVKIKDTGLNPIFDGDTPLHEAIRVYAQTKSKNAKKVIGLLIQSGANIGIKNKSGFNPVQLAKNLNLTLSFDDIVYKEFKPENV